MSQILELMGVLGRAITWHQSCLVARHFPSRSRSSTSLSLNRVYWDTLSITELVLVTPG